MDNTLKKILAEIDAQLSVNTEDILPEEDRDIVALSYLYVKED